jgi:hypothetical protein
MNGDKRKTIKFLPQRGAPGTRAYALANAGRKQKPQGEATAEFSRELTRIKKIERKIY